MTPSSRTPCPAGAGRVDAGLDEHRGDLRVGHGALVGAAVDRRVQRAGDVELGQAARGRVGDRGQEPLDLIRVEVRTGLEDQGGGAGDDGRRHRRATDLQVLAVEDALRAQALEGAAGGQRSEHVRAGGDDVGLGEAVLGDAAA
jgi:hypothetical protein